MMCREDLLPGSTSLDVQALPFMTHIFWNNFLLDDRTEQLDKIVYNEYITATVYIVQVKKYYIMYDEFFFYVAYTGVRPKTFPKMCCQRLTFTFMHE